MDIYKKNPDGPFQSIRLHKSRSIDRKTSWLWSWLGCSQANKKLFIKEETKSQNKQLI